MKKSINFQEVKKDIRKNISGIIDIPIEKLTDDARFVEDLGVDSMMALEIIASIEKKYRVVVPEEEITKVHSLNNIYEIIEKLLSEAS